VPTYASSYCGSMFASISVLSALGDQFIIFKEIKESNKGKLKEIKETVLPLATSVL